MAVNLVVINSDVFVFEHKSWSILRTEHRIIGTLIGGRKHKPALPLLLMPEEAHLVLTKQIGRVVKYTQNNFDSGEFETNLLEAQRVIYRENRKRKLEGMLDKIVAGKRRKGDLREETEILNEVVERSCQVTKENMIWPIPYIPFGATAEIVDYKHEVKNELKYLVFKDLWESGYCVTGGGKFGGDFLVYKDDPIIYHAIFIVRCVKATEKMMPADIVAFGRLATTVKKSAVLASLVDDKVSYITVNWIDD